MRGSRRGGTLAPLRAWACLLLVSSACATTYGPRGFLGAGFSEQKLAPDLWLVTFDANAFTPREQVHNYLLLRCAEITLDQGDAYFILMPEGPRRRVGPTVPSLIDKPPFPIDRPAPEPTTSARSARAAIRLYKEKPEEKSYDARALVRRLAGEGRS